MPQLTGTLLPEGAIVDVLVGLARADIQTLRQSLRPIPQPMPLRALIDSGAQVTCLDPSIIRGLACRGTNPRWRICRRLLASSCRYSIALVS
jgi:hypothetical protein